MSLERDPWRGIVYNGFSQTPGGGAKARPRAEPRRGWAIVGLVVAALGVVFTVAAFALSDRFLPQIAPPEPVAGAAVVAAAPRPAPATTPVVLPSPPVVAELKDQPAPSPTPSVADTPPPASAPAKAEVEPTPRPHPQKSRAQAIAEARRRGEAATANANLEATYAPSSTLTQQAAASAAEPQHW